MSTHLLNVSVQGGKSGRYGLLGTAGISAAARQRGPGLYPDFSVMEKGAFAQAFQEAGRRQRQGMADRQGVADREDRPGHGKTADALARSSARAGDGDKLRGQERAQPADRRRAQAQQKTRPDEANGGNCRQDGKKFPVDAKDSSDDQASAERVQKNNPAEAMAGDGSTEAEQLAPEKQDSVVASGPGVDAAAETVLGDSDGGDAPPAPKLVEADADSVSVELDKQEAKPVQDTLPTVDASGTAAKTADQALQTPNAESESLSTPKGAPPVENGVVDKELKAGFASPKVAGDDVVAGQDEGEGLDPKAPVLTLAKPEAPDAGLRQEAAAATDTGLAAVAMPRGQGMREAGSAASTASETTCSDAGNEGEASSSDSKSTTHDSEGFSQANPEDSALAELLLKTARHDAGTEPTAETRSFADVAGMETWTQGVSERLARALASDSLAGDAGAAARVEQLQSLVARFGHWVAGALSTRGNTMNIHLSPASLGQLTLRCREEQGRLSVDIAAETREARHYLTQHEAEIKSVVQNAGYKMTHFDVHTQSDDGGRRSMHDTGQASRADGWGRRARRAAEAEALNEIELNMAEVQAMETGRMWWVA